jgi:ribonuclease HII
MPVLFPNQSCMPACVRVQGFDPESSRAVVKGDNKSTCIAAASVIAKVTRDRIMEQLHERWPLYNFAGAGPALVSMHNIASGRCMAEGVRDEVLTSRCALPA